MSAFIEIQKKYYEILDWVTSNANEWTSFLNFAGTGLNYNLRFDEQLLVYEQKPEATATMTMRDWNKKNKWIIQGTPSIRTFNKERKGLNYYFDLSDVTDGYTGEVKDFTIWNVAEDERNIVLETLIDTFGEIERPDNFADGIIKLVDKVVEDNVADYLKAGGKYIGDKNVYTNLVKNSVAYILLARLGVNADEHIKEKQFEEITNFEKRKEIETLGNAIRDISYKGIYALRETVLELNKEREKENESENSKYERIFHSRTGRGRETSQYDGRRRGRNQEESKEEQGRILQTSSDRTAAEVQNGDRGKLDSVLDFRRRGQSILSGRENGKPSEDNRSESESLRQSEVQLSQGLERGDVQGNESGRYADGIHRGDPVQSEDDGRESDKRDEKARRDNRGAEKTGSDEVGRTHEQSGIESSRNSDERIDIQLKQEIENQNKAEDNTSAFSMLGAEDEQHLFESKRNRSRQSVESLAGTQLKFDPEAEELTPAFFITENTIDKFLLQGSNTSNARKIIVSEFSKSKSDEELIEVLKKVYHGGYGMFTEEGEISAWYAEDGIHLAKGKNAKGKNAQVVSWKDVVIRINGLLENGEFATNIEIVEASSFERSRLSESLIYLAQDVSVEGKEQNLLGCIAEIKKGSFVNIVDELAEKLSDSYFVNNLLKEYEDFKIAYTSDRNILRFHFHDVEGIYQRLQELKLPRRKYDTTLNEIPKVASFITEDEIFETLSRGSSFSKGKERITNFFSENQDLQDRAEFLKKEYGTGGRNYAISNTPSSNEDYDSKGIKLRKSNCKEVFLTWPNVSKYIDELISKNLYIVENEKNTEAELDETVLEDDAAIVEIDTKEQEEPAKIENSLKLKISFSENPLVHELLGDKLPAEIDFALGNRILSDIDRINNELMKGYDKTDFVIEAAIDGEEFRYEGRYDLGDGEIDLIEHIRKGINAWQENFGEDLSLDGKERAEYMLNTALPFLEERRDLDEIQQRYYEGSIRNTIEKYQRYLEVKNLLEEDESNEASSKLIIKYDGNNYLFDYSYIGRTIEDGAVLAIQLVSESDPSNVITITYEENEEVKRQIDERVGLFRNSEVETLNPEIQNSGQSLNLNANAKTDFNLKENPIEPVGKKERFRRNLEAINVLKECEFENRFATEEEQLILSKYVGWGGLSEAFDEDNKAWENEFVELYTTLSPSEYASARESTLSAFYTPPEVSQAMYKALSNLGFKTGNILEPSCGTGNFIGMLPESMKKSKVYGVELDKISAAISKQLYQSATITQAGYENTEMPDNFFDIAIGNVPFGDFKINDKRYNKHNFLIHDYFFAKTIDKVRTGGVIALVTSKGTMDKENPSVRKYIAQRAELLGAIRLPNDTFKGNAGTEAVSDILFLKKRDRLVDIEPEWVKLKENENGIRINSYFADNPNMILGEMKMVSGRFGMEATCESYEDRSLSELLNEAIKNIKGEITNLDDSLSTEDENVSIIAADPTVRNYSFTELDGKIYFRENSIMKEADVSKTAEERIKALMPLREQVRHLIELQKDDYPKEQIEEARIKLNTLYDKFVKDFGYITSRANSIAFGEDSSYPLLSSLETVDSNGTVVGKADMFYKRTIKPHKVVTSVDTISEAYAVSLSEFAKVNIEYMMKLSGKTEEEIVKELQGVIYLNPDYAALEDESLSEETKTIYRQKIDKYLPADEYLSGNVRKKLEAAEELAKTDNRFADNANALRKVIPEDLTAAEISVRLGATWIQDYFIEEFMKELLETPSYLVRSGHIDVRYSEITGEWTVKGKNQDRNNVKANTTYGTARVNAYKILEDTLNLKEVRVIDYWEDEYGKKHSEVNKKETAIAQSKQELIKEAFKEWTWKDPQRREHLTRVYNDKYNSIRAREYDGSHIAFNGINPEIELKEHQKNAIAHILYGGNTLLAHAVGAGKTFEMVAAAQESKRLGLCNKSMFVVPNHLTEQWAAEYMKLYPAANILVATKKDFETKNRKRFCGRIATGDYDAVIIGHSQFEKIPMSVERQRALLEEQLDEIVSGIKQLKATNGERFTIKDLEKTKKKIEVKLEKLNDQARKDDVVTFEELGVDKLFVDESHYYKNLYLYTKMRNVGGIAQTEAQKSSDLFMKCRYLDELTGNKGVVFATGTPISNSMVELYTLQRYLQYDTLKEYGLSHFDNWASTFGETVNAAELTPEGTGYRAKTRFSRFYNLPELMAMFKETADIKTAEVLELPVPEADYINVSKKPSQFQKDIVASFAERAEKIREGNVDPSVDNMLKITHEGRILALDQRLINPNLPDYKDSKVNTCVQNVYKIWEENTATKATQLIFCDLSTPKNNGEFSVYNDIKEKLIAKGIPETEIAFIHDATTDKKKEALFGKVRNGEVRVLLGSTQKMGAGTNVQERLIAIHNLDCPWRPSDLEQRAGRIVRQGNSNEKVEIYRYVTEETFDAYLYQIVEGKQRFASQIMTNKLPARSAEDIDEVALSFAEVKMLATGNPLIKEKMELDIEVTKLKLLKANYLNNRYELEDKILKSFPNQIRTQEERVAGLKKDIETALQNPKPLDSEQFVGMELDGKRYLDKKEAGTKLLESCKLRSASDTAKIGCYRGFEMHLEFDSFEKEFCVRLKGATSKRVPLGSDIYGNITRLDNGVESFKNMLKDAEIKLKSTRKQLEIAKLEMEKPFEKEDILTEKIARLSEVNALLDAGVKEEVSENTGNALENGEYEKFGIKLNDNNEVICVIDGAENVWINKTGDPIGNTSELSIDFSFLENSPRASEVIQLLRDICEHYKLEEQFDVYDYENFIDYVGFDDFNRLNGATEEEIVPLYISKEEYETMQDIEEQVCDTMNYEGDIHHSYYYDDDLDI